MTGGGQAADALARAGQILGALCGTRVRSSFPVAPLTSFRIGGPAALYLEAEGDADLAAAARAVSETGIEWTVIGKGSNLLVSDRGFHGLVIKLGRGYRWAAREGTGLQAGAAMPLPALAGVALAHSLTGLEFGVAIPGSVGGAVRMNAGAHGRSMQDVVEWIDVYSVAGGGRLRIGADAAGFDYRRSSLPEGSVVVVASVALRPGEPTEIRKLMDEAREWRRATQPLAEPNCGSVFKNPPGDHAARLVEDAGAKGMTVGGATISEKHANFIVTGPGATAADVLRLIRNAQQQVLDRFGVELETEVQIVGDFDLASL